MPYRGLLVAIAGVVVIGLGYAIGLLVSSPVGAWAMIAGMVVLAIGLAIHLLTFINRSLGRRK